MKTPFGWKKGHPSNDFPLGLLLVVKRISPRFAQNFRTSIQSELSSSLKPIKICDVALKRRLREPKDLKRSFSEKEGFRKTSDLGIDIFKLLRGCVCFWRINEEDHMRIVSMQKGAICKQKTQLP